MNSLEPRLIEYLKKKNYYKQNNFPCPVGLNEQYSITKQDLINIQNFNNVQSNFTDMVDRTQHQPVFKKIYDPRQERLIRKQNQQKQAEQQRHNYDLVDLTRSLHP